jgi:hypothetical protein
VHENAVKKASKMIEENPDLDVDQIREKDK